MKTSRVLLKYHIFETNFASFSEKKELGKTGVADCQRWNFLRKTLENKTSFENKIMTIRLKKILTLLKRKVAVLKYEVV